MLKDTLVPTIELEYEILRFLDCHVSELKVNLLDACRRNQMSMRTRSCQDKQVGPAAFCEIHKFTVDH